MASLAVVLHRTIRRDALPPLLHTVLAATWTAQVSAWVPGDVLFDDGTMSGAVGRQDVHAHLPALSVPRIVACLDSIYA